jgi:hypothetical protein
MNPDFINLTVENLENEHLCCTEPTRKLNTEDRE